MVDFDASPQLRAIRRLMDAYVSLNMNKIEPLLSKNYQQQPFPPSTFDLPEEVKRNRFGKFRQMSAAVGKLEIIYHEVIDAPGKVVLHITAVFSTVFGATLNYDSVLVYTLVEEDGELKILHLKHFGDPKQRGALIAGTLKAMAERAAA